MRILLAIGHRQMEDYIKSQFPDDEFEVAVYREAIIPKIESFRPNVVILREVGVNGSIPLSSVCRKIRTEHNNVRVIFMCAGEKLPGDEFIKELVTYGIYDIIHGVQISLESVKNAIITPCTFKDVEQFVIKQNDNAVKKAEEKQNINVVSSMVSIVENVKGGKGEAGTKEIPISAPQETSDNCIMSVIGKGGCSATALSIAYKLSQQGQTLYIEFGANDTYRRLRLNILPDLVDAYKNGEIYGAITQGSLVRTMHEIYNTYPDTLDYATNISAEFSKDELRQMFSVLQSKYKYIICDINHYCEQNDVVNIITYSNRVVGVIQQDISSLVYLQNYWNMINLPKCLQIFDYERKGYEDTLIEDAFKNATTIHTVAGASLILKKCMAKQIFPFVDVKI